MFVLFVYGTLRRGEPANRILARPRFIGFGAGLAEDEAARVIHELTIRFPTLRR